MKQTKFGNKVQNWHKPLGPSQQRRKYLQLRDDSTETTKRGQFLVGVEDKEYRSVEVYPSCWGFYAEDCRDDYVDVNLHNIDVCLAEVQLPPAGMLTTEQLAKIVINHNMTDVVTLSPISDTGAIDIEERVLEHFVHVTSCSKYSTALESRLSFAIGNIRNLEIIKSIDGLVHDLHLSKWILLFSPFWIRSPETWDKNGQIGILDHLFVQYEVPDFLYQEWFHEFDYIFKPNFKWLCWFILLGQGGSLKRAAEIFNWNIFGKFQYYLQYMPHQLSPSEACFLAEVRRLGGSEKEISRLQRNPSFIVDPTEPTDDEAYLTFWQDTVRWLIVHRDAITVEESDLILAWAMHEYTESLRRRLYENWPRQFASPKILPFSWKGRSLAGVLERSIEYRFQLQKAWVKYKWKKHNWDWTLDDASSGRWSFVELTSGKELFEESRAMHHCVSTYAKRCVAGNSAILSLKHDGNRCATVEINPSTKQLIQAKGTCNRAADADEMRVIGLWIKEVVLRSSADLI